MLAVSRRTGRVAPSSAAGRLASSHVLDTSFRRLVRWRVPRASDAVANPARGASGAGGAGATGTTTDPTPPAPPPAPRETSAAAARELESMVAVLDPMRVTEATARASIAPLLGLLPKLATWSDTLEADQLRAGAHIVLGETEQACTILRALQGRAPAVTRTGIQGQIEAIGCR